MTWHPSRNSGRALANLPSSLPCIVLQKFLSLVRVRATTSEDIPSSSLLRCTRGRALCADSDNGLWRRGVELKVIMVFLYMEV